MSSNLSEFFQGDQVFNRLALLVLFFLNSMFIASCGLNPDFKTLKFEKPVDILGCKEISADNFNKNANAEDGSCVFTRCFDSTQDNFDDSDKMAIDKYISENQLKSEQVIISNCNGRSGCLHNLSKNKDATATKENGSCLFEACMDNNYHEFIESDFSLINEYITLWGESYNGNSRLESSCSTRRKYCKHPEAFNYTGPTESRGDPYCIFYACTKKKYEGEKKYLEYLEYLKNNPGEIIEDNSSTRCGAKLVKKNTKEIDVKRENIKSPVDVVFIIDDSRSMDDEATRVKEGLIDIAPTLQDFNAEIKLELHKIDNVNKNTKSTVITNTSTSKITRTEYLRPSPAYSIDIFGNTLPLPDLESQISKGIDAVMSVYGDGNERGACYIQRILESFKNSNRKNLITVLISDEDDHEKGSSKNCYIHTDKDSLQLPPLDIVHTSYKDSTGKDDLINVITEGVIQLSAEKIFALTSIHWNKNVSKCTNNQGFHAENYIRLVNQLKNNKKISMEGDICEKDYATLLNTTLAETIRTIIGFKYIVSTLDKNPVVEKIEIITTQGDIILLNPSDYSLEDDGINLYVKINESFSDILKNASKIRIIVTEDE